MRGQDSEDGEEGGEEENKTRTQKWSEFQIRENPGAGPNEAIGGGTRLENNRAPSGEICQNQVSSIPNLTKEPIRLSRALAALS